MPKHASDYEAISYEGPWLKAYLIVRSLSNASTIDQLPVCALVHTRLVHHDTGTEGQDRRLERGLVRCGQGRHHRGRVCGEREFIWI